MRLQRLTLENFQGIKHLDIDAAGKDITVYGANGTGKTTIANAISYLLYGITASGKKDWNPKTLDENGDELHGLTHSAEAVFQLEEDKLLTLKKAFHEVYAKNRNTKEQEFKGHTTDYFIDGKPVSESLYRKHLDGIFQYDKAIMLSIPDSFPEKMNWADRRSTLIGIFGDVSNEDVYASDEEFGKLEKKIGSGNVDDYRESLRIRVKNTKEELEKIQPRIDEAERAIPDLTGLDKAELETEIGKLEKHKAALIERKASLNTDSALIEARDKLSRLSMEYNEKKAAYNRENDEKNREASEESSKLSREWSNLGAKLSQYRSKLRTIEQDIKLKSGEHDRNAKEYLRIKALEYKAEEEPEFDTVCPCCRQPLPEERIMQAKADWEAESERKRQKFEEEKKRKLDIIASSSTDCSKKAIEKLESDAAKLREDIEALQEAVSSAEKARIEANSRLIDFPAFRDTPEGFRLQTLIDETEEAIRNHEDIENQARKGLDDDIRSTDAEIDSLRKKLYGFSVRDRQLKRIEELKREKEGFDATIADDENYLGLADRFVQKKVSMLSDRINSNFENVSFRMFEQQVNGGIKEVCEPMVKSRAGWIPYYTASNAEKINGGLEIINTLSKALGLEMPIVIDNAEAVCDIVHTEAQQIRLVVSSADITLRIEH